MKKKRGKEKKKSGSEERRASSFLLPFPFSPPSSPEDLHARARWLNNSTSGGRGRKGKGTGRRRRRRWRVGREEREEEEKLHFSSPSKKFSPFLLPNSPTVVSILPLFQSRKKRGESLVEKTMETGRKWRRRRRRKGRGIARIRLAPLIGETITPPPLLSFFLFQKEQYAGSRSLLLKTILCRDSTGHAHFSMRHSTPKRRVRKEKDK